MKITITFCHTKSQPELEDYIEDKILKYEKMVLEPTIVDVVLDDLMGSKGGNDKKVAITAQLSHVKGPLHLEESTNDFTSAFDLVEDRFARHIERYHEKVVVGSRFPHWTQWNQGSGAERQVLQKYSWDKIEEKLESKAGPGRVSLLPDRSFPQRGNSLVLGSLGRHGGHPARLPVQSFRSGYHSHPLKL